MKVQSTLIPWDSLIQTAIPYPNFEDCFSVRFTSNITLEIDEVVYKCFSTFKGGWVNYLFKLRDWLVKPFNLKTSEKNQPLLHTEPKKITTGGKVTFFDVVDVNNEEVLLYAEDLHLEAYFAISLQKSGNKTTLTAATTVNIRNSFGKAYMTLVKPFHKLIVRSMLQRVAKEYTKANNKLIL